ncbi:hypothetical protein ACOJBM_20110 [Rhizobium beringeri]
MPLSLAFCLDRDGPHMLSDRSSDPDEPRRPECFQAEAAKEMSIPSIIGMVRIIANQSASLEEDSAADVVVGIPLLLRHYRNDHPGVFAPVIRNVGSFIGGLVDAGGQPVGKIGDGLTAR